MCTRISSCPTIKMQDPVAFRPSSWKHIDQWTLYALCILVNQIKRLWQKTYSAKHLTKCEFSIQNVRYFSNEQYPVFQAFSNEELSKFILEFFVQDVAISRLCQEEDNQILRNILVSLTFEQLSYLYKNNPHKNYLSSSIKEAALFIAEYYGVDESFMTASKELFQSPKDVFASLIGSEPQKAYLEHLTKDEQMELLLQFRNDPSREFLVFKWIKFTWQEVNAMPQARKIALYQKMQIAYERRKFEHPCMYLFLREIISSKQPILEEDKATLRSLFAKESSMLKECLSKLQPDAMLEFFRNINFSPAFIYEPIHPQDEARPVFEPMYLLATEPSQLEAHLKQYASTYKDTRSFANFLRRVIKNAPSSEFFAANHDRFQQAIKTRNVVFLNWNKHLTELEHP